MCSSCRKSVPVAETSTLLWLQVVFDKKEKQRRDVKVLVHSLYWHSVSIVSFQHFNTLSVCACLQKLCTSSFTVDLYIYIYTVWLYECFCLKHNFTIPQYFFVFLSPNRELNPQPGGWLCLFVLCFTCFVSCCVSKFHKVSNCCWLLLKRENLIYDKDYEETKFDRSWKHFIRFSGFTLETERFTL